jgi:hypothetical protein
VTTLARSFGKSDRGALVAGKTSRTVLANPAMMILDPRYLNLMAFSLGWMDGL